MPPLQPGFPGPGTYPRGFLVLPLVVVLELVQDNVSHSVAGLDHQVLIGVQAPGSGAADPYALLVISASIAPGTGANAIT